jgi:hypothetical protein
VDIGIVASSSRMGKLYQDSVCLKLRLRPIFTAIPNLELEGASRKLRTLVIVNLSYKSTNMMSGEPLCNFREAYNWNCCNL